MTMTKKEWLLRAWDINDEVNELIAEQRAAYEMSIKTTNLFVDDVVKSSENRFINYANYSNLINKSIDKLYYVKNEILAAINIIDNSTIRTLLIKRYISFKTFEEIAVEMNYSYRQVLRLHRQAFYVIECHI